MPDWTAAKRHILEHAVGFRSKNPFYRNHYTTGPESDSWPILQELVKEGLMWDCGADPMPGGMHTFQVTEAGKETLK